MTQPDRTVIEPGRRFGCWTVLSPVSERSSEVQWKCRCVCSAEEIVVTRVLRLRARRPIYCKHKGLRVHNAAAKIRPGQRFTRWTVIEPAPSANRVQHWLCRCSCDAGTERSISASALIRKTSKSCGCRRREMGARIGVGVEQEPVYQSRRLHDKHARMHTCENCQTSFNAAENGLVVTQKGVTVTGICGSCMSGSRLVKLVLRRGDIGTFSYEQFSIIETVGGMSSKRAG